MDNAERASLTQLLLHSRFVANLISTGRWAFVPSLRPVVVLGDVSAGSLFCSHPGDVRVIRTKAEESNCKKVVTVKVMVHATEDVECSRLLETEKQLCKLDVTLHFLLCSKL